MLKLINVTPDIAQALNDIRKTKAGIAILDTLNSLYDMEINFRVGVNTSLTSGVNFGSKFTITVSPSLTGIPVGNNVFATYDMSTMLIHELSHVYLFALGKTSLQDEDLVASLYDDVNGVIDIQNGTTSLENSYTKETNYFINKCGLYRKGIGLQRTSYQVASLNNWTSYSDTATEPGTYNYYTTHPLNTVAYTVYGGPLDDFSIKRFN